MISAETFSQQIQSFFKFSAVVGFLATTTLLINLNHFTFQRVFGEGKSKSFWWLFVLFSVIPLLVILYIFNIVFNRISLEEQAKIVLNIFRVR